MKTKFWALLALLVLTISGTAVATTTFITFSEFSVGTIITNQYLGLGDMVTFSGALDGPPIIADDFAMPNTPVLSPNPPYAGTFNINFPLGATGVQFDSGYWDTLGSGVITLYAPGGGFITTLSDTTIGVDHFNLTSYGDIGRISFDSTADPEGADIDNLQFARAPEPGSLVLFGSGVVGLVGLLRRKFIL